MRAAFLMFSPPQYRLVVTTTTKLGTLAFRLDHDQPFEDWDNLRKFTNVIVEKETIGTASVRAVKGAASGTLCRGSPRRIQSIERNSSGPSGEAS